MFDHVVLLVKIPVTFHLSANTANYGSYIWPVLKMSLLLKILCVLPGVATVIFQSEIRILVSSPDHTPSSTDLISLQLLLLQCLHLRMYSAIQMGLVEKVKESSVLQQPAVIICKVQWEAHS